MNGYSHYPVVCVLPPCVITPDAMVRIELPYLKNCSSNNIGFILGFSGTLFLLHGKNAYLIRRGACHRTPHA